MVFKLDSKNRKYFPRTVDTLFNNEDVKVQKLESWDMAAAPIIRKAGGKITNIKGEEWTLEDKSILATNPRLHKKLFDLIR